MNDQAYGALLAAVEMDVRAQSKESKALLITLLKSGAVPREAINRALGQFEGAYYKTLADAYGTVLGTTLGVQQIRELPVSGVKLSDALYAHGKQTSAEVLGIIKRHANAMHDARGLAMQIYDGYGHRAKEAINLNPRNQKLPKYLREALAEDPSLGPSLQRLIAQAQITQIRTPALRAAYQKALDDFEAGAGTRRLDKALDVAYQEKMRYNANRIAQTELHRAYSDQKAREYMAEESLEVVQVRMSGSHPKTDICDLHSKLDKYGLGPGCYPKPLAPKPSYHPHCRCKLVPRWDLSAKGAREQGNAERLFLEDIGEKEGMRIVGSQARYFDIVKRGAKLEEVLNRGKDPLYQFARVGDVAPAPAIAPPVVAPLAKPSVTQAAPHRWYSGPQDIDAIKSEGKQRLASIIAKVSTGVLPDDRELVPLIRARGMPVAEALASDDGAFGCAARIVREEVYAQLKAVRGVGGQKIATHNKTGKAVEIMRRVASVYPDDWVAVANRRPLRIAVSQSRGHYISKEYNLKTRTFEAFIRTGEGSVAEHEYAHHLQEEIQDLDAVFQAEHARRTAGHQPEALYPNTPRELGRPDGYVERYQGREYSTLANKNGGALEVMTMALQAVAGSDSAARRWFALMLKNDPDMLELTIGLLFHFKP